MKGHKGLHMITFGLMALGAINWLLLAVFGWEVGQLFGGMSATISKVIYIAVGLAAIYEVVMHKKHCRMCNM